MYEDLNVLKVTVRKCPQKKEEFQRDLRSPEGTTSLLILIPEIEEQVASVTTGTAWDHRGTTIFSIYMVTLVSLDSNPEGSKW